MQTFAKLIISVTIILVCVYVGRKQPLLAGLIAVMPLTGLIVLLWLYSENHGNREIMTSYAKGAFWGIIPSLLFFLVAFLCFKKNFSLPVVLLSGFSVWLIGALLHQLFLK